MEAVRPFRFTKEKGEILEMAGWQEPGLLDPRNRNAGRSEVKANRFR